MNFLSIILTILFLSPSDIIASSTNASALKAEILNELEPLEDNPMMTKSFAKNGATPLASVKGQFSFLLQLEQSEKKLKAIKDDMPRFIEIMTYLNQIKDTVTEKQLKTFLSSISGQVGLGLAQRPQTTISYVNSRLKSFPK